MDATSASILFISGAGLPSWIWDQVREQLGGADTTAVAPRPASDSGVRAHAQAALGAAPTEQFAVVAHSAGGVIAAELAQLAPERVTHLLGVSAIVPLPGDSFISAMPMPNRLILSLMMRLAGTRPPESAIRGSLAKGLDAATVDRIIAEFEPESQAYYRDPIGHAERHGKRGYLSTATDAELTAALQERFATNLGADWRRILVTGHLPMLENPRALSEAVSAFVA